IWNEVSMTKELWRQLCLRRWAPCKPPSVVLGTQTWKQYYLCRSELEFRVESGRPQDFVCKAISGHTGQIDQLAYVSPNEYRFDGGAKSVVCTVSSDCTVRAWDLHEGTEIWSSPVQPAPLVSLVAYPQLQLVVTVDTQGLIIVWKAETGCEQASFCLPTSSSAMEACDHPDGTFLLVFHTQSLPHQSEDKSPVSTTFPIRQSSRACWAPDEAARLMVMHRDDRGTQLVVTTFELKTKKSRDRVNILAQQLASFPLPDTMMPHLMQGHGSQMILLASRSELVLFTIHGLQLVAFQDHQRPITSMWVDLNRVITSSLDLSLRVYVWNKENKLPVLKSCYHLLGGSHRWASGFTHVKSDSMSIAGVEARSSGTSILRSYYYKVQLG
uniref:F-box and WD-40 domain protein 17 n=1 Tax=Nannospalax galili TaxID=1026970 RepID=A0A8C6QNV8_NANGA